MEQQPSPLMRVLPAVRPEILAKRAEAEAKAEVLFGQLMEQELAHYLEERLPHDSSGVSLEVNPAVLRSQMTREVNEFDSRWKGLLIPGYLRTGLRDVRMAPEVFRDKLTAIIERVLVPGGLTYEWVQVPQERAYSSSGQQMHRLQLTWPKAQ